MKTAAFLTLISHWRRHPIQAAALIIGLSLAVGLWIGVQAINAEARKTYAEAAGFLSRDHLARLEHPSGFLTLADFATLRRAGWLVTPIVEGDLPRSRFHIVGIDPFTMPPQPGVPDLSDPDLLEGFLTTPGVFFAHPDEIAEMPDRFGPVLPLLGVTRGTIVTDVQTAQRVLEQQTLTALLILPIQPNGLKPLSEIAPNLVQQSSETSGELARLTDSFHLNLSAFGLLSCAVGLFIVYSTIGLAFEQRRGLFRTLRALGLPLRQLLYVLCGELGAIAIFSGGLGVVIGYLLANALLPGVSATLSGLYGAGIGNTLSLSPLWWASGFAIALVGAALAGAQSIWITAQLPVLSSAKPRAWAMTRGRSLKLQIFGAGLGVTLYAALAITQTSLWGGFAMLAALLLGAACLLPPLLAFLIHLLSLMARSPLTEWFWADTRQQLPGLSLALMALLLALAANIGVSTMVGSFRQTFTGWLDQRLVAEVYVSVESTRDAEALLAYSNSNIDAILPIQSAPFRLADAPGDLFGVVDHETYRRAWPLIAMKPGAWDAVATGEGIMVNEQLARRADLWPGSRLELTPNWNLPVVGVYSDYGNPRGQAMVSHDVFMAIFPDVTALQYAIRTQDSEDLVQALEDDLGLPQGTIVDQAAIKALSLQIFERTFLITSALNILTLGVAAFALWAAMTSLAAMRLPQVAPVWAMGVTRRKIAVLEFLRTIGLAWLTLMVAVPVGLVLAWTLLAVVNVVAFGWRLPMAIFPIDWFWLGVWTAAAAVLAAALPVVRLARISPSRLLQVFANEN